MIQALARMIVRTFFREVIIEGRENIPAHGPIIFTPNHPNGLLDPLIMFLVAPSFPLRFIAKEPLFRIPVFGSILRSIGAIPVVRRMEAQGEVDYTAFFESCVNALAAGDSIIIFPEGRSLPQAYLAPLRTGPARLFLLARSRGVQSHIIPVGINYERGTTFRSSVLVVIAPAIDARSSGEDSTLEAKTLTSEITESLRQHVVQAETYRDRELMLLLERLASNEADHSWMERFRRLKQFENGLNVLHPVYAREIDRLRKLLERYERLSVKFGMSSASPEKVKFSVWNFLGLIIGGAIAGIGWLLNVVPYRATDLLIRLTRKDESDAATFKVIYALFLFPAFYFLEGVLLRRLWGAPAGLVFGIGILPLSYFTLYFSEWRERTGPPSWISGRKRVAGQLQRLRERIATELQRLASRPELR